MMVNLRQLMFALIAVLSTGVGSSQTIKCNADGQKLIKRISSDILQIDGTIDPGSYNDTYDMTYFSDGRLKSITMSCRDFENGGRFAERILIEADTFNIVYLNNGKKNPNQSAIVKFSCTKRHGVYYPSIESITRMTKEKDAHCDYIHRFWNIFFHDRYRSLKIETHGAYDNIEDMLATINNNKPDWLFSHDYNRSYGSAFPDLNLKDAGFKREICWFEGQDGYIYFHDQTTEKLRQEQDGNLYTDLNESPFVKQEDVFTDLINDTNMNLQFFFEIGMPELMSEWIPVRSKNLIKYEDIKRYGRNGQDIRYKKFWEYDYDSAGNLTGATVIRTDVAPKSKYMIKIEYVTE